MQAHRSHKPDCIIQGVTRAAYHWPASATTPLLLQSRLRPLACSTQAVRNPSKLVARAASESPASEAVQIHAVFVTPVWVDFSHCKEVSHA